VTPTILTSDLVALRDVLGLPAAAVDVERVRKMVQTMIDELHRFATVSDTAAGSEEDLHE